MRKITLAILVIVPLITLLSACTPPSLPASAGQSIEAPLYDYTQKGMSLLNGEPICIDDVAILGKPVKDGPSGSNSNLAEFDFAYDVVLEVLYLPQDRIVHTANVYVKAPESGYTTFDIGGQKDRMLEALGCVDQLVGDQGAAGAPKEGQSENAAKVTDLDKDISYYRDKTSNAKGETPVNLDFLKSLFETTIDSSDYVLIHMFEEGSLFFALPDKDGRFKSVELYCILSEDDHRSYQYYYPDGCRAKDLFEILSKAEALLKQPPSPSPTPSPVASR